MTAKRHISVDPVIPTMIGLTIAAFIAGVLVWVAYLAPAPPPRLDPVAAYCRGNVEGMMMAGTKFGVGPERAEEQCNEYLAANPIPQGFKGPIGMTP